VLVFIQKSVTPYFIDYKDLPIIYVLIGVAVCFIFIYLLVRKFEEMTNSPFFYLCVYILMTGLLAGVVRSGGTNFFPNVPARYEHYSVAFMASFIGLTYGFIRYSKIKAAVGIFFLILFFTRFYKNTVSYTIGYQYDTFVTPNGQTLRKLIDNKDHQYLHDFGYENIAQNASLRKEFRKKNKKEKRVNKTNVRVLKYKDEKKVGVVSFIFKEKKNYKNIRVILQQGKKTYSLEPYQTQSNKYYCVIAKNGDLPKGKYLLRVWYEDEQGKYEYKLKSNRKIEFY